MIHICTETQNLSRHYSTDLYVKSDVNVWHRRTASQNVSEYLPMFATCEKVIILHLDRKKPISLYFYAFKAKAEYYLFITQTAYQPICSFH